MNQILRLIAIGCGVVLATTSNSNATDAPDFRWKKAVTIDTETKTEVFGIRFDADVFAATQARFEDVRLLDADLRPVPSLIRKHHALTKHSTLIRWTAKSPELNPSDDGLEIKLKLDQDDPQPTGLLIVTPLKNFTQRVEVFRTEPGVEGEQKSVHLLYDYSRYMDARRATIPLSGKSREFRLVIKALTVEQESEFAHVTRHFEANQKTPAKTSESVDVQRRAFRVDRIEFTSESTTSTTSEVDVDYPIEKLDAAEDTENHRTILTITTKRQPLTSFVLATQHQNFERSISLQVPQHESNQLPAGAKTNWTEIASGKLSHFSIADYQEQRLKIDFVEQRHETYRVVIENGDSAPIKIDSIIGRGRAYEVVWLATEPHVNWLAYGSDAAKAPNYDTAALKVAIQRDAAVSQATIGPQEVLNPETTKPVDVKSVLNNPLVIGAIVCVLVVFLGLSLFRAGKQISAMPDNDAE